MRAAVLVSCFFLAFTMVLSAMSAMAPVCEAENTNSVSTNSVSTNSVSEDILSLIQVTRSQSSNVAEAEPLGDNVRDLHKEYYNIFKSGTRNAASHLWSSFLLEQAKQMTHKKLTYMFSGFCAVSGSPLEPMDRTRYKLTLDKVGGGKQTGYMYYCCWPCLCDTQDFIRIDTKTVATKDGNRQYHFAVIGNPCDNPEKLSKPFKDPFSGKEAKLQDEAPEVKCDEGKLHGAHVSDHGHIILSMFFDEEESLKSNDQDLFKDQCTKRKEAGFDSGMGDIFRKVAGITRIS